MVDSKPLENLCQVWELPTPESSGWRTQNFKYFQFTDDWTLTFRNTDGDEISTLKYKIQADKILVLPDETLFAEIIELTEDSLTLKRLHRVGDSPIPQSKNETYKSKAVTQCLDKNLSVSELGLSILNSQWLGIHHSDKGDLSISLEQKKDDSKLFSLRMWSDSKNVDREVVCDAVIINYEDLLSIKLIEVLPNSISQHFPISKISSEQIHFKFSDKEGDPDVILKRMTK